MKPLDVAELDLAITGYLPHFPRDIDLVVGIPRRGLLAATMIALYLNLPLTDVEGLCEGRLIQSGPRLATWNNRNPLEHARKVLVVDYEVVHEDTIQEVRRRLGGLGGSSPEILFTAVYVTPRWRHLVDFAIHPLTTGELPKIPLHGELVKKN
jgi:orotate phosphoribosyltransferase